MQEPAKWALVTVPWCLCVVLTGAAQAGEEPLPEPLALSGEWELLAGHGSDNVAADPQKFKGWQKVSVPGVWPDWRLACAWQVKRFRAPANAQGLDCEVVFGRVRWRSEVWLNGKKLGTWPDGYAPFRLLASDAVLPGKENVLAVRVGGFGEVPKSKSGRPLFPAGFATRGVGGGGGIMGRVWVRFFRRVRLTRVQVLPDLGAGAAKVLVRVEGGAGEAAVALVVSEDKSGREVGRAEAVIRLAGGTGEAVVPVRLKEVKTWEPSRPFLYRLEAAVRTGGELSDRVRERFGMREIANRPDGFYLNGRKVRLFGSNVIGDYGFWRGAPNLLPRAGIRAVLVEPARRINAVCVRTHTAPIPKWWLDVCDEEGLMILLEFPVTVNCGNMRFDAVETATFQKNLEAEASAIVPYLANHPSVVMWVMTNESNNWPEYERTRLYRHFKKLDPSRPAIRAAYDTPDADDVHFYGAIWKGSSGDFEYWCRHRMERARARKLPLMLTEYLDGMGARVARKWLGPDADSGDPKVRERIEVQKTEFRAERAMEQTEAARRLGYDCILPFGPGFWLDRDLKPSPTGHAIASAMAPVGVSLDWANQHFVAGSKHSTDVWVMNDTHAKVTGVLRCLLSGTDPGFDPTVAPPAGTSKTEMRIEVGPHAVVRRKFAWSLPAEEGRHYLLARFERAGAAPVTSRRAIWSIERRAAPKGLAGRKVLVIEEDDKKLSGWAGKLECKLVAAGALEEAQLVVVAPGAASGAAFKAVVGKLPRYVWNGGRLLVLEQFEWPALRDLLKIEVERTDYDRDLSPGGASGGSSRVFRWEQPRRPIWAGIPAEYLWRWNGSQGRVARVSLSALPGRSRILVRYGEAERDDLKHVPVAAVPHGQGEVLYFMLQTDGRYDPSARNFDPVVERLMLNLLNY